MVCRMMERLPFSFSVARSHTASVREKLDFFFLPFLVPERKVIEMSEKGPGSLETLGSLKCQ